ncbi:hypothetical protein Ccrd_001156 [Cynara cardunculus var. scolymus]|uniref:Uncharacterized protein n=1 Tax=Cynara cardunculus var. scolymus TaxID=59895 RepID=A0A103XTS2_CYNCS|nr:hypothetical protein Ccrd_001156 [Cynara cardunculus var. scolymus]
MASEAPSWADQWGAGGIGAIEEEKVDPNKETNNNKNNKGSTAFGRANSVAKEGAKKLKNGTSNGIKWIKNKCQKKNSNSDLKE